MRAKFVILLPVEPAAIILNNVKRRIDVSIIGARIPRPEIVCVRPIPAELLPGHHNWFLQLKQGGAEDGKVDGIIAE